MFDERFHPSESGEFEQSETIPAPPSGEMAVEHMSGPTKRAEMNRRIRALQNRIDQLEMELYDKEKAREEFLSLGGEATAKVLNTEMEELRKQIAAKKEERANWNDELAELERTANPYESDEAA